MDLNTATSALIIGTVLVWLFYDVILYVVRLMEGKEPKTSTISIILTEFSWYSPALPMACGILIGHWFWPA